MCALCRPRLTALGLLILINALSVHAQTTPPSCPPGQVANPPGVDPPCYTPLPPEWTPRLAFYVPTMPVGGGSVPMPGYVPPPLPGELYITVPITWDLYQATVTYIGGTNPQVIYGTFNVIRYMMQRGDSFLTHLSHGPCFVMMRHQIPAPNQATVVQGLAQGGETSVGGAATSINGTLAACATVQTGVPTAPGDVTITVD